MSKHKISIFIFPDDLRAKMIFPKGVYSALSYKKHIKKNLFFIYQSTYEREPLGRHGFIDKTRDANFSWIRANHLNIPSEIRVTNSPEYTEWFCVCV